MKLLQQLRTTVHHAGVVTQCLPPGRSQTLLLRDRERQRLQRRERVKQLVDLESTHHAPFDAPMWCQFGDVFAQQRDAALGRLQHTGEQIDQGRLARAVGADQRMACALF